MINVIGTDAAAPESLPAAQQELIRQASLIAAPSRLHGALRIWLDDADIELIPSDRPRALCAVLAQDKLNRNTVVLASGDPLWFGIGRTLIERLGKTNLRFHPAPTSLQLAFARLNRPWQDVSWVSLHGRDSAVLMGELQKRPVALAILTDPDRGGAETVRNILQSSGLAQTYQLWVCENLGQREERINRFAIDAPLPDDIARLHLAVLIAEEPAAKDPRHLPLFGLEDGHFLQHPDHPGLMTKREVRIQLLADLELPEQGVLWDLGAGTGSVGLEALRLRPGLQLLAVERRHAGAQLIQANAERLGVQPAAVLETDALELETAVVPDHLRNPCRVLLGGGGQDRVRLLDFVLSRLQPGGVVVMPLATLEAVSELRRTLDLARLSVGITQLQAWRGLPLGDGTRLAPMNPAFVLKGRQQPSNSN